MTTRGFLHLIIEDFFLSKRWRGGYGLLNNYPQASQFSRQVNDRQRRRYIKFGRVPMPFIWFLRDAGVCFAKTDEKLRGITVQQLEATLVRSESDQALCTICDEAFKSIIKHLEYECLVKNNTEIIRTYCRLVSRYHNDYAGVRRESCES